MTLSYHLEAQLEVNAACAHYEAERVGLGQEFLDALDAVQRSVSAMPQRFPFFPGTQAQRALLKRFPYFVIFEQRSDVIRVLAVGHQHREPLYWAKRT